MPDAPGAGGWWVEEIGTDAAALHAREPGAPLRRSVWIARLHRPALVLGSTQADDVADRPALAAAGVDLVRRRSGGGAVLLEPEQTVWVDLVLPAGDPRWHDDVGRAAHWVGEVWAAALGAVGVVGAAVHRGGLHPTTWSPLVCVAGVGPGEVLVDGRKAVGVSQRRTRAAARFQTVVGARGWDATAVVPLLALDADGRRDLTAVLRVGTVAVPATVDELVDALLAVLADAG